MSHGLVYRAFALSLCLCLFYSSSAAGLHTATTELGTAVKRMMQERVRHFTDKPIPVKVPPGGHKRDAKYRGGVWNDRTLKALEFANGVWGRGPQDILWASMFPQAGGGDPGGGAGGGEPFDWEGSVDAPSEPGKSLVVNTNTGNLKTSEPIISWPSRGLDVDITLYHNSDTIYSKSIGHGWSSSYDIEVVESLNQDVVLRWGDGTTVGYVYEGQTNGVHEFVEPGGIHDVLNKIPGGYYRITQPDGTVYILTGTGTPYHWKVTSITDRAGNTVTIQHSGEKITRVTCPTGRYADFFYTSTDKLEKIRDPEGREWAFTFVASFFNHQLQRITFPVTGYLHSYKDYTYTTDNGGLFCMITRVTDLGGREWDYTYHSSSNQVQTSETPMGFDTAYGFGSGTCTITYPGGGQRVDYYTSGRLTTVRDPDMYTVQFVLDGDNNVTSYTDQRGKVWTATYDTKGNLTTSTNPLGKTWSYGYNATNDLLVAIDPLMNQHTLTWDSEGNLLTVTDPLSRVVMTNTYDGWGQLLTTKNALNHTTTIAYDADGNVDTVTDPTSRWVSMVYDTMGRPMEVINQALHSTEIVYDASKRPKKVYHPDGNWAEVFYDNKGNVSIAENEKAKQWVYTYDNDYRLTATTNPLSQTETYTLNDNGWATSVQNGRGYSRTYTYTNRGEVETLLMPDGTSESWSYDGSGNVTLYQNGANGTGVAFEYDNAGRSTKVNYPTNTDTTFGYDIADRLTSMVDGSGTTTWTYNAASEVSQVSSPQGTLFYTYDNAGRRASIRPGWLTTPFNYAYDAAGRLSTYTTTWGQTVDFTYDTLGRESRRTFTGGHYEDRGYDVRDRLTSVILKNSAGAVIRSQSYTYQANSNVATHTVGSVVTTYGYDDIDQLISETDTNGYAASYQYDANGNRAQRVVGGVTENYAYDSGDKLSSVVWTGGSKSFTYDGAGNTKTATTSAGTRTYNYDEEGRLTGITYPSAATNSFTYNGFRARGSVVDSTGTKAILRDGQDAASPIFVDSLSYHLLGGAVGEHRGGSTFWFHGGLKNNDTRTNTSGVSQSQKTYDAFGNEKSYTG